MVARNAMSVSASSLKYLESGNLYPPWLVAASSGTSIAKLSEVATALLSRHSEPCGADLRFISISPISARALSGKSPKLTIPRGPLAVPSWAPAPHQGERREGRGVAPSAPPAAPPSFGARRPIRPDTKGGYGQRWRRQPRACPAARSSAWAPWPPWPPEPPGSPAARRQAATAPPRPKTAATSRARAAPRASDVHIHNVTDTSWMTPPAEVTDFAQEMGLRRGGLRPRLRRHHRLPRAGRAGQEGHPHREAARGLLRRPWATSSPR